MYWRNRNLSSKIRQVRRGRFVIFVGSLFSICIFSNACDYRTEKQNHDIEEFGVAKLNEDNEAMKNNAREYTPLVAAILAGDEFRVRALLMDGADPNAVYRQLAPLGWALTGGRCNASIVRLLIESGADIEFPIWPNNPPPLHRALTENKRACVDVLLKGGANIFSVDRSGGTTIHAAASVGMVDLVEEFASQGVDVSVRNSAGWTALMIATLAGQDVVVERLIQLGIDPCVRDSDGIDAAEIARRRGLDSLAKKLRALC